MKINSFKILKQLQKVLFFLTIDIYTKGNGIDHKEVVKENRYGKMDLFIRDTGKII